MINQFANRKHDCRRIMTRCPNHYKNYGNASFHCQQALEKIIKAAILKDGTLKLTGQAMGHIPFIKIYESRLPADYKKKWRDNLTYYDNNLVNIIVLNTMKSDGFLRTLLWKLSLNIPLPELIPDNDYYYIPLEYRDPRVISLVPNSELQLQRFKRSSTSREDEACPVHFVFTNLYLDQYRRKSQNKKKTYQDDDLLGHVLDLLHLYMIAYPHESMGRYSIEVGDLCDTNMGVVSRNTYEWYELQRFELKKLIDEITCAVTQLDKNLTSA